MAYHLGMGGSCYDILRVYRDLIGYDNKLPLKMTYVIARAILELKIGAMSKEGAGTQGQLTCTEDEQVMYDQWFAIRESVSDVE